MMALATASSSFCMCSNSSFSAVWFASSHSIVLLTASVSCVSTLFGALRFSAGHDRASACGASRCTTRSRHTSSTTSRVFSTSSLPRRAPERRPSWRRACWQKPWIVLIVASSNVLIACSILRRRAVISPSCPTRSDPIHGWRSGTSPLSSTWRASNRALRVRSRSSPAAARVNVTTSSSDAATPRSATYRTTRAVSE